MTAHDKFTFKSEPGFCPDCGSILPLLGATRGVTCYTCHRSFGPEVFGTMEHSYTVHFNTINTMDTKKKADGKEDTEGPIVERRCPKSNLDSTRSAQLLLDQTPQSRQEDIMETSCQGKRGIVCHNNNGDVVKQERNMMSPLETKIFITGIEEQIEYAEDRFKYVAEKLCHTREVFLKARQANKKGLPGNRPMVQSGKEILHEKTTTHLTKLNPVGSTEDISEQLLQESTIYTTTIQDSEVVNNGEVIDKPVVGDEALSVASLSYLETDLSIALSCQNQENNATEMLVDSENAVISNCGSSLVIASPSSHSVDSSNSVKAGIERVTEAISSMNCSVNGNEKLQTTFESSVHHNDDSGLLTDTDEGTFVAVTSRSRADWSHFIEEYQNTESYPSSEPSQEKMSKSDAVMGFSNVNTSMECNTRFAVPMANSTSTDANTTGVGDLLHMAMSPHTMSDNKATSSNSHQPTISNVPSKGILKNANKFSFIPKSSMVFSPDSEIGTCNVKTAFPKISKCPKKLNLGIENNVAKKRSSSVITSTVATLASPCSDNNIPKKKSKSTLNFVEPKLCSVDSKSSVKKKGNKSTFHSNISKIHTQNNDALDFTNNFKQMNKCTSTTARASSSNLKANAFIKESNHAFPTDTLKTASLNEIDIHTQVSNCSISSTSVITLKSKPSREKLHHKKRSKYVNNYFNMPKMYALEGEANVPMKLRKSNVISNMSNVPYPHGKSEALTKEANVTSNNSYKLLNIASMCPKRSKSTRSYGSDVINVSRVKGETQIPSKRKTSIDNTRVFSSNEVHAAKQRNMTNVSNISQNKQTFSNKYSKDNLIKVVSKQLPSKPCSSGPYVQLSSHKKGDVISSGSQLGINTKQLKSGFKLSRPNTGLTTKSQTAKLGKCSQVPRLKKSSQTTITKKLHNKSKKTNNGCVNNKVGVKNNTDDGFTMSHLKPQLLAHLKKKSKCSILSNKHVKIKAQNQHSYVDYHCENVDGITGKRETKHVQAFKCVKKTKANTSNMNNIQVKIPINQSQIVSVTKSETTNHCNNFENCTKTSKDREHKLESQNKSFDPVDSICRNIRQDVEKYCLNGVNSNTPESNLCLENKEQTNLLSNSCLECANALNFPGSTGSECRKTIFLLSSFPRHYEVPTISSRMKRVLRRPFINPGRKIIPFIVAKSTMPSHNINVQIQDVISIIRSKTFKGDLPNMPDMPMLLGQEQNTSLGSLTFEAESVRYHDRTNPVDCKSGLGTPQLTHDNASISTCGTKLSVLPSHFTFHEWKQPHRSGRPEHVWSLEKENRALASVKSSRCCNFMPQKESNYQAVLNNYIMNTSKQDVSPMSPVENSQEQNEEECFTASGKKSIVETDGMRGRRLLCEIIGYLYTDIQWISENLNTNSLHQMVSKEELESIQEKVAHNTTIVHETLKLLDEARELQNKYRKLAEAVAQNIEFDPQPGVTPTLRQLPLSSRLRSLMLSIKNFKQELRQVS